MHGGACYPFEQCECKLTGKGHLIIPVETITEALCYPCDQCQYKAILMGNLNTCIETIHEVVNVCYPCKECEYKATQNRDPNNYECVCVSG